MIRKERRESNALRHFSQGATPAAKKWDGHASGASKEMGVWGLAGRKDFRTTPSRTSENSPLQGRMEVVFIVDFIFGHYLQALIHFKLQMRKQKS